MCWVNQSGRHPIFSIVRSLSDQTWRPRCAKFGEGILSRDVVGHTRTLERRLQGEVVRHAGRKGRQQNRRTNMTENVTLGFKVPIDLKPVLQSSVAEDEESRREIDQILVGRHCEKDIL